MTREETAAMLRGLKVGDTVEGMGPVDRQQLQIARMRRTRMANLDLDNPSGRAGDKVGMKILREASAKKQRESNAIEQAATFLRRKGYPVYDRGIVHGPPHKGYQVGREVFADGAAMMAHATRLGWRWEG